MDFASNFEDAVKIVNEKKLIEYANTTKMKISSNGRIFWILLGIKVICIILSYNAVFRIYRMVIKLCICLNKKILEG